MKMNRNIIKVIESKECYGCSACAYICPTGAIYMIIDKKDGFLYPIIDENKCKNCGLCDEVCPVFTEKFEEFSPLPEVYAAWSKNTYLRILSSSGGIATSLAYFILNSGGIVCGASFSNDFQKVAHILVKNPIDVFHIIGSKYLQSDMSAAIRDLLNIKDSKEKILVVGTPCQIYGLRNVLKKLKMENNVFLIDFFCHGVPSYYLWYRFAQFLFSKIGELRHIDFRFKGLGWHNYQFRAIGERGIYIRKFDDTFFGRFYLSNYFLRDSCYNCKFASINSGADMRIGDFWGPLFSSNIMGVSICLVYTDKGRELLKICNELQIRSLPMSVLKESQPRCLKPNILRPTENNIAFGRLKNGESLNKLYRKFLLKKYVKYRTRYIIYLVLKSLIPKPIQKIVKKIRLLKSYLLMGGKL